MLPFSGFKISQNEWDPGIWDPGIANTSVMVRQWPTFSVN